MQPLERIAEALDGRREDADWTEGRCNMSRMVAALERIAASLEILARTHDERDEAP